MLDFATRKKNQTSGGFFVDSFFKEGPKTLEQLQAELAQGNMQWLEQLSYYSQHVHGSPGYWRSKRAEVYSWINHHIEAGNGPPSFFITLSCAEYMWPDIKQLILDRCKVTGLSPPDLNKSFVQTVNDYTVIVQEYFQERVQIWLCTIGAEVFHIKHYWLWYEFAPSRGQIHAHMLAIQNNSFAQKVYYDCRADKENQEQFLYKWMTKDLGITAWLPTLVDDINFNTKKYDHPFTFLYKDALQTKESDFLCCLQKLQYHRCSAFCMRKHKIL